jgi:hypothetical protein
MAEDRIKCPFCAELIQPDAKKCRFCGEWLVGEKMIRESRPPRESPKLPEDEQDQRQDSEAERSESESPGSVQALKAEPTSTKKERRFPWLRIILFIAYAIIIVTLACSERKAQRILQKAQTQEKDQDYQVAFKSYFHIVDAFPYSWAFIKAQEGVERLSNSYGLPLPRPSWLDPIEDVLGHEANVCEVYPLSFLLWPVCAVLLALVFLTRLLRPGTAFIVLLLLAVAIGGSVVQLSWYGRILSEPVIEGLKNKPVFIYFASYVLLIITALMTLTATRKRRNWTQVSKKKKIERQ